MHWSSASLLLLLHFPQLVSQELQAMDKERMAQVRFLEERVRELSQRVDGYESLEKELDDVVLQAAESELHVSPIHTHAHTHTRVRAHVHTHINKESVDKQCIQGKVYFDSWLSKPYL